MALTISDGNLVTHPTPGAPAVTLNKPANVVNGDVLLAVFKRDAGFAADPPGTVPTGWVKITVFASASSARAGFAYYKIITNAGGEPTSYTWSDSGAPNSIAAGFTGRIVGANTTTPSDAAAVAGVQNSNSTSVVAPAITTVTSDAMVLCFCVGLAATSITMTQPSGTTEFFDAAAVIAGATTLGGALVLQAVAGSSGTKTYTLASKQTGAVAYTWAVRPAVVASADPFPFVGGGYYGCMKDDEGRVNWWKPKLWRPKLWTPELGITVAT